MKKIIVTVEKEITVSFDENDPKFIELFEGYKRMIDDDADFNSLAENIASMISRYGIKELIEGVGYVKHNGEDQTVYSRGDYKPFEGIINVEVDTDINGMVDFEVSANWEED